MPKKLASDKKTANIINFFNKNRIKIIPAAVVIVFAILLYFFKSVFIAATVNGEPISRLTVIRELEKKDGKTTISSLVTKSLILQEARKKNINITDKQISDEIKKLEDNFTKQGQNLDQLLTAQGMTREDLKEQIKTQKMIESMIGKGTPVTDKEIQDYIDKNKDSIPATTNPEDTKSMVKQQLEQQKLDDKFQTWLSELEKKAKINYFVTY